MAEIKLYDKLEAVSKCTMEDTGEETLTIGKFYEITDITDRKITIRNDEDTDHYFPINGLWDFFKMPIDISK